jgi:nucleoside phosphorylase
MSPPIRDLAVVCFAVKEEAAPFQKIAAASSKVSILITGMGRANAENALRIHLAAHSPTMIFTCGFAGGLDPALQTGDVFFETGDPGCREQLTRAGARPAKFFCAGRIATTVAEKKKLREQTGADAVEMESAAIHAVAREQGIPCATVRAISDTANEDLPLDFNALLKADKNLDLGRLALAVAKSPGKIPALLDLQKKTRLAAQRLADVLQQVFVQ